ncbi:unnamed protein product [Polarella glacialis]|uniref:Glycosyltransferase 61 catalytic domain-containing protein n=2 Tax=Polarella glacialis TaxID=89957 RepID=A0A813L0B7_POLGL|nr:unnamed protein product [Polarella glacialis]
MRVTSFAAVLAVCAILCLLADAAGASEYDKRCNEIEEQAQAAGGLYTRGRQAEAFAAMDGARDSFRKAKELAPNEPQAFISLATALMNANQLNEALPLWRSAQKRVDDPATLAWLQGRERWTRFGKVSMRRDKVYSQGQGNVTAALLLMAKQLEIYPQSPVLLHDRATAKVMVSELPEERGEQAVSQAIASFKEAQEAAFQAWQAGLWQRSRAAPNCGSLGVISDWPAWWSSDNKDKGAMVSLKSTDIGSFQSESYGPHGEFQDQGSYVARFNDVGLSGEDGIIVDEKHCGIFIASAGPFVNLARNLQLLQTWGDPPSPYADGPRYSWLDFERGRFPNHGSVEKPKVVERVASLVQFASTSFFHLLAELLSRLWILQKSEVLSDPALKLVVPQDPRKDDGFIVSALRFWKIQEDRVIWWPRNVGPDVQLQVKELFYADWRPPASPEKDGGHCPSPRSALLGVRQMLLTSFTRSEPLQDRRLLIFASRQGVPAGGVVAMRSRLASRESLLKGLRQVAEEAGLEFIEFSGVSSPEASAALFARARAVVGIHGGALTNMLFCREDADIFELGFATPLSGHYRHLGAALGLRTMLLPLKADDRGIGAAEVVLADMEAAIRSVRARLLPSHFGGSEGRTKTDAEL